MCNSYGRNKQCVQNIHDDIQGIFGVKYELGAALFNFSRKRKLKALSLRAVQNLKRK
jgi:hypothetical protein